MGPSSAPHAAHRPRWRIRQTLAGCKDAADYVTKSGPSNAVIAAIRACALSSKATAAKEIPQRMGQEGQPSQSNQTTGINPSERRQD